MQPDCEKKGLFLHCRPLARAPFRAPKRRRHTLLYRTPRDASRPHPRFYSPCPCPLSSPSRPFRPAAGTLPTAWPPCRPITRRFCSKVARFRSASPRFSPITPRFLRPHRTAPAAAGRPRQPRALRTPTPPLRAAAPAAGMPAAGPIKITSPKTDGANGCAPLWVWPSPSPPGASCTLCPPSLRGSACSTCRPTCVCRSACGARRGNRCAAAAGSTSSPSCSWPRWARSPSATAPKPWA